MVIACLLVVVGAQLSECTLFRYLIAGIAVDGVGLAANVALATAAHTMLIGSSLPMTGLGFERTTETSISGDYLAVAFTKYPELR